MREPFFNDLSIKPLCETDQEVDLRVSDFVKILKFCGEFLGYRKVKFDMPAKEIELKKDYFLREYLAKHATGNSFGALLLLNMLQPPCIEDDSEEEIKYATHTAKLKREGKDVDAYGFACAYYSSGFVVGFASDFFWKSNSSFTLSVMEDETGKSREHNVFCISQVDQFNNHDFISWAIDNLPLYFRPSGIEYAEKKVALRDDHGKNVLLEFSKKIKKESYIIEIVNSLPFKRNIQKKTNWIGEGIIEVRLLGEKNKIGVAVRTTAKNEIEGSFLAADIEKKYL